MYDSLKPSPEPRKPRREAPARGPASRGPTSRGPASRRAMANVDLAWLRMDCPTNRMTVTGLLTFDRAPDLERLRATLERRLLRFPRFRQRVAPPSLLRRRPAWQDVAQLDLAYHLPRTTLPPPADEESLRRRVGELMSGPLDPARPLWQFLLIDNYGPGGAVVARIHHAIADGIALMNVLLSLTDETPDGRTPDGRTPDGRTPDEAPAPEEAADHRSLALRLGAARSAWGAARRLAGQALSGSLGLLTHPARALDLAAAGVSGAATLGRLLLRPPDPATVLKGELGVAKRAAWSETLALDDVKAVARVTGSTVNDVLLSAMTGALGRYLKHRGEAVKGLDLHAAVPVNLRSAAEMTRLGNRFGLVFPSLPVGIADPLDRLFEIKRRMDALKAGPEAAVSFAILGALGLTSDGLQRAFIELMGAKTSLVMTNVPGPRRRLYLAGSPLRGMMFWVPQSGRVGLGISILSYAGEVRLGLASDAGLLPDPERIAATFSEELEALMELVRQAEAA